MEKRIVFLDTTLRDGEQTPGAHMSIRGKVDIARQLERLGVDYIEAGFPASSEGDAKAVAEVAAVLHNSTATALARASVEDVTAAASALAGAKKKRIHVFIATSDIHMECKLKMSRDEVIARISEAVALAKTHTDDIEFSAEDATRSDIDFLCRAYAAAVAAGATTINIPDTVGYTETREFASLIETVKSRVLENREDIALSVHCHDDLGLAVANSLAAVAAGATQVETTINGIGERAGNAAFEEIVMALTVRADIYGATHGINTIEIYKASRLVSSISGIPIPPNKAVVGANAFAHEAGIHQHGMLCDRRTYEIMSPEQVGVNEHSIILGKLSGKHAFAERAHELGYDLSPETLAGAFESFKFHADRKPSVTDEDIIAIINEQLDSLSAPLTLETFQIQSGNRINAMAMISIKRVESDEIISDAAIGKGPIDAAFNAVDKIIGAGDTVTLESYNIKAVTEGTDALGEVMVRISADGSTFTGRGVSSDIIKASIKAYISAVGKYELMRKTK